MADLTRPVRVTRRNFAVMQSKENNPVLAQKNVMATKQAPTLRATLGEISNRSTAVLNNGDKKSGLANVTKFNFNVNPYSNASKENDGFEKSKGLAVKPLNKVGAVISKPVIKATVKATTSKQVTGVLKRVSSLVTSRPGLSIQNVNKPTASLLPSKQVLKPKQVEVVAPKPIVKKEQAVKEPEKVKVEKTEAVEQVKPKIRDLGGFSSEEILKLEKLDQNDKCDAQNVADYVGEIYDYLQELEVMYNIPHDYIKQCKFMTYHMRGVLIDWLVEVHRQFKLMPETLYLAVSIFDRYMPLAPTTNKLHLQLVGIVCLLIASKYEEIMCPTISDCVYMTDKTYTNKQVMEMEMKILGALNFNIGRPLPLHFLRRYTKTADATYDDHAMSKYLMELMLVRHEMCHINPSLQAAAALCLSLWVNQEGEEEQQVTKMWNSTLQYVSGYSESAVKEALRSLITVVVKGHQSNLMAVKRKFSTKSHAEMSHRVEAALTKIKALAM